MARPQQAITESLSLLSHSACHVRRAEPGRDRASLLARKEGRLSSPPRLPLDQDGGHNRTRRADSDGLGLPRSTRLGAPQEPSGTRASQSSDSAGRAFHTAPSPPLLRTDCKGTCTFRLVLRLAREVHSFCLEEGAEQTRKP